MYGSRKIHHDLLNLGEACAENTVAKLMSAEGLGAQVGYKRRPGKYGGQPSIVAENQLDQDFDVASPDQVWGERARHRFEGCANDITYIHTHEGWLYLAFSGKTILDRFRARLIH